MRTWTKLTTGAVAAGLALTACGSVGGPASRTHQGHARALSQHQVQQAGFSVSQAGFSVSDVKDLAAAKREHWDALLRAAGRAQSR
jgi:hypothetical protein